MSDARPRWALHLLLFVASLATMVRAGVLNSPAHAHVRAERNLLGFSDASLPAWWQTPDVWSDALLFALPLMAILFAHEMGHYLVARRMGVRMSPPFFLPWFEPFGSMGAVIAMEPRPMSARQLMRVAAAGPFAGMVVAIPVIVLGAMWSEVRPLSPTGDDVLLGECLLFGWIVDLAQPTPPPGHDVFLHPMAFAGWAGCFITALNLLPIAQLDGGHILYALFGDKSASWARGAFAALIVLGALLYPPWVIIGALVAYVMGVEHPALLRGPTATGRDRTIGRLALALFILTFTPRPFIGLLPGLLDLV